MLFNATTIAFLREGGASFRNFWVNPVESLGLPWLKFLQFYPELIEAHSSIAEG